MNISFEYVEIKLKLFSNKKIQKGRIAKTINNKL